MVEKALINLALVDFNYPIFAFNIFFDATFLRNPYLLT